MKYSRCLRLFFMLFTLLNPFIFKPAFNQESFQKIIKSNVSLIGYTTEPSDDGGFIVAGQASNSVLGGDDIVVVKYGSNGSIEWSKAYGGSGNEFPRALIRTGGTGYAILGNTSSYGSGNDDIILITIDLNGQIIWSRTYGGFSEERGFTLKQLPDGYILGGSTQSFGIGLRDAYIIRTDNTGEILWTRVLGGGNNDNCFNINLCEDGGYIFTGVEYNYGPGSNSILLTKLSSNGNVEWAKALGGSGEDHPRIVLETEDNGLVILAHTQSWGAGDYDPLIVKTDKNGNLRWAKTYGGTGLEHIGNIVETFDGGFAIGGSTTSFGSGPKDLFIIRTDSKGDVLWANTYGGSDSEGILFGGDNALWQTPNGGFFLTGQSDSFSDNTAIYLVKTDNAGVSGCHQGSFVPAVNTVSPQVNDAPTSYSTADDSELVSIQVADINLNDSTLCPQNLQAGFSASALGICINETLDFFDQTLNSPTSWLWEFEGGIPHFSSDQNPSGILYENFGSFDVKLIVSDGISGDTLLKENYIQVSPNPEVSLGDDQPICEGGSIVLDAGPGFDTYSWSNGSGNQWIVAVDPGEFWVTVTTNIGCPGSDTILIYEGIPEVDLGEDRYFCEGSSTILSAQGEFTEYLWSTGENSPQISVNKAGTYWLKITTEGNCTNADTISVFAYPGPTVISVESPAGGTLFISATDGTPPYQYSINDSDYQSSNEFIGLLPGNYTIYVRDLNGCESDTMAILPEVPLKIPNFFTPNGDNIHDTWEIEGIQQYPDATITIFDRYGKLLISYYGNEEGWDGIYNGQSVLSDTYWYQIVFHDGQPTITGDVTIKR